MRRLEAEPAATATGAPGLSGSVSHGLNRGFEETEAKGPTRNYIKEKIVLNANQTPVNI